MILNKSKLKIQTDKTTGERSISFPVIRLIGDIGRQRKIHNAKVTLSTDDLNISDGLLKSIAHRLTFKD